MGLQAAKFTKNSGAHVSK